MQSESSLHSALTVLAEISCGDPLGSAATLDWFLCVQSYQPCLGEVHVTVGLKRRGSVLYKVHGCSNVLCS